MRFGLILGEALTGLRRNASMVISVVLVTFVSLTFVGAAILMQAQIGTMRAYWQDRAQVAVYMCSSVSTSASCADGAATEEQIQAVRAELDSDTLKPLIAKMSFQTSEEAYKETLTLVGKDYAGVLSADQVNAVFKVNLKDQTQSSVIAEAFHNAKGVDEVKDQLEYLDPLFNALTVATYIAIGIAVLMLIAAVLLIGTTIRLSAYARRREIGIMRLVGASNRFIQTPFVLEGVFAAVIGSVLASVTVLLGVQFGVHDYLSKRVPFITTWVGLQEAALVVPVLIGIGVVLAALSAGFAIRRWLRA
ncbi:permease-like cell division protein FtsX [uncultured Microbacterium sp.]|uniref:permease-like cell division protein FtsX n=1 Tax=uncultured Microbacterium sp. TaxID=191216 RepID=UPI0025F89900|nr:permease-like cell division protein FtsX [uncultured Microbacterium sp.]